MEFWGVIILLIAALVIGLVRYYLVAPKLAYAGVAAGIAAAVGGFVASEYLGTFSDWGMAWSGLNVFPALIGAVLLAVVVDVIIRLVTREGLPMRERA